MSEQITVYSKPVNKYNLKGRFYNIYLNKNSNLDLSSLNTKSPNTKIDLSTSGTFNNIKDVILQSNPIAPNPNIVVSQNKGIFLEKNNYSRLVELFASQNQLLTSQKKEIENFITSYQEQAKKLEIIIAEQQQLLQSIQSKTNSERRGIR